MVNRIPDDRSKSGALGNLMAVKGRKEHWWILEFLVPETLYDRVLTRTKLRCCHLCRWKKCKDLSCSRVLDAPVTLTRTIKQAQNPTAGFCLISALIGIDNFYISNARFQSVMHRGMGSSLWKVFMLASAGTVEHLRLWKFWARCYPQQIIIVIPILIRFKHARFRTSCKNTE